MPDPREVKYEKNAPLMLGGGGGENRTLLELTGALHASNLSLRLYRPS